MNGMTSFMKRLGAHARRVLLWLAAPAWRALKRRWSLQAGLVLIVALALAWSAALGRERTIAVAFLALGAAIASWPGLRRGFRKAGKLGVDAALEGVASSSLKFGTMGVRVVGADPRSTSRRARPRFCRRSSSLGSCRSSPT